ncbi:MAG: ribosome silencing factor [Bradymonadales bacterium]|jgi:ribosome-associated protein
MQIKQNDELTSEALCHLIVKAAVEKKAINPVVIDVRGHSSYAEYLVVCSGRNDRHVNGIANGIDEAVAPHRICLGNEGLANGQWVLLDYDDVIVHVFYGTRRHEYDLEKLWADVPRVPVDVPSELRNEADFYE